MVGKEKDLAEISSAHLSSGVREDCEELLRRFSSKPTVRFQDFIQVWHEMGFNHIFSGRPNFRELLEFVEELFAVAKAFMFSPYPYRTRIGGIYIMYGLYFKQPFNDKMVSIKLDLKEWKELVSFVELLVKDEHFDTFYIMRTLVEKHAFSYEASSIQYGFDRFTREKLATQTRTQQKFDPMKYGFSLFDETDFVDEWSKFETMYHKLRNESEILSASESHIPKNWPVEVLHSVASASMCVAPTVPRRMDTLSEDEDDNFLLNIGKRRSLLKNRSFAANKSSGSTGKIKKMRRGKGNVRR
ncbi:snRNA-activating protein complex subunit 1 [Bemisia tabaci]|uniref:snRNA-activating protein complex subunit 1 n=1 Tax=Bemisia tabaci TaxID=7038 RepID=UPI003B27D781